MGVALSLLPVCGSAQTDTVHDAMVLLDAGHPKEALAMLNAFLKENPKNVAALVDRGLAYSKLKRTADAIENYDQAIAIDPADAAAYTNRGTSYLELGQTNHAFDDFAKAVELAPSDAIAHYDRGVIYSRRGKNDLATADYTAAISSRPHWFLALVARGRLYAAADKNAEAVADFSEALAPNADMFKLSETTLTKADVYIDRGNTYYILKNYPASLADFTSAIVSSPKYARAYATRGHYRALREDYARAILDYQRALAIDPKYAYAQKLRGEAYEGMGNYPAALRDYNAALKLTPKYAAALRDRSQLEYATGNYVAALRDLSSANTLDKDDVYTTYVRGDIEFAQGRYDAALSDFQHWLVLDNWKTQSSSSYVVIRTVLLERHAHQAAKATALLAEAGKRLTDKAWPSLLIEYLNGSLTEQVVRAQTGSDRGRLTDFHAYVGIADLWSTGPARNQLVVQGRQHLRWVLDHGKHSYTEYPIARELLKQ